MRVPHRATATAALAAVLLMSGCASSTLVDASNSRSLYLLVDSNESTLTGGTLYEYGPGDEHPRSARLVSDTTGPWMDAAGDLYLRHPPEGVVRYDARTWASKPVYRGDVDDFAVDANGKVYAALQGGVAVAAAGSTRPRAQAFVPSAAIQGIVVDAHDRAYVATMPDGHIRVYDDLRRPPLRVIAAPRGLRTLALDARGHLYGLGDTGDEFYEYANAMAKPLVVTEGVTDARQIAFDKKGDVYVLNGASRDDGGRIDGPGSVVEYAYGVPDTTRTIPLDAPISMAIDDAGDLYVSSAQTGGRDALYVYGPDGTDPIRRYDAVPGTLFFGASTRSR